MRLEFYHSLELTEEAVHNLVRLKKKAAGHADGSLSWVAHATVRYFLTYFLPFWISASCSSRFSL